MERTDPLGNHPKTRVLYLGWRRDELRGVLRKSDAVELFELDLRSRGDIRSGGIGAVLSALRFGPDLVFAESIGFEALLALLFARHFESPLVVRLKGDPEAEALERPVEMSFVARLRRRLNLFAAGRLLARADAILPVSPHLEPLARRSGREGALVRTVPLPFRPAASAPPVRNQARPSLVSVTNFNFRAKIEPLLLAVPILAPLLEQLELPWTIFGSGAWLAEARRQVDPWKKRVVLAGFGDVGEAFSQGPIVLHLSGLDGLPNALLEAAAAELPIVVNRGAPGADWIVDGETGLVIELDAPASARQSVARLAGDPDLQQRLGRAAGLQVRSRFSETAVLQRLEAALGEIGGRSSGPRPPRRTA